MALVTNKQAVGLVVIGVVGVWYARNKAKAALNAVNPMNEQNVINQGYINAGGGSPVANGIEDVMYSSIVGLSPLGYIISDEAGRKYGRGVFGRIARGELGK